MTVVAVPDEELRALVGPFPDGGWGTVWDWRFGTPPPAGVQVLVSSHSPTPPSTELFTRLPDLRMVQLPSSGVDHWLPVLPAGVTLCNGRGIHSASTAEAAVAGILAVLRRLPDAHDAQRAHRWRPLEVDQIAGRRAAVLGAGDIGTRIARSLRALDVSVTLYGRTTRDKVLGVDQLPWNLPDTEILIIAAPLTSLTRGLVGATLLAALPDGAVVANVSRGPVLDTDALVAEVRRGRLRAFLDVTDPEPLPPGHPLWDLPGVVLTPHTGGGETAWRRRFAALVGEQVRRLAAGLPPLNQI